MRKCLRFLVVTLCTGLLSFFQASSQCVASDVTQPANQSVCVGSSTTAVNFTSTVPGTSFTWTNSNPAIGLVANGSGNIPSFTTTNTTKNPLTASVTVTPYNGSKLYAYIPNYSSNNVSVVDVSSGTVIKTIAVGTNPVAVAASPDGRKVYISNSGSNSISVINTITNTLSASFATGSYPYEMAISQDGSKLYVANFSSNSVSVINTATNTITSTITVATNPTGVVLNSDGSKLYVACGNANTVSVINTASNTLSGTIAVSTKPSDFVFSPDGSKLYVTNSTSNNVSVINTATNNESATITVGTTPNGIVINGDGSKLYVANYNSNDVSVINTATNAVSTIGLAHRGDGISITPDGSQIYVASGSGSADNRVSVINTATNTVSNIITVGNGPVARGNMMVNVPCAGTPKTFSITVNPIPDVAAVANQTFCAGTATTDINFTSSVSGTVFGWSNNYTATGLMASGSGKISSFIPTNTSGVPLPSTITVTPYTGAKVYAYIPNYTSKDVAVIDVSTGTRIKSINLGEVATGVVPSPDGLRVYIAKFTSIDFINTITNTVDGGIYIGDFIYGVAVSPDGSKVYASHMNAGKVTVANTQTGQKTTITVGANPYGIAVSPDGKKVYVANAGSNTVSVIDATTNTVSATITVGFDDPRAVVVSSDGSRVYVVNRMGKTVSVINTATNVVSATVAVGTGPENIAISPDGSKVYVSNKGSNTVSVINTSSNSVVATVPVGTGPNGVSVTPDGSKVYVANGTSYTVSVIDAATNTVSTTITTVGTQPFGNGNMMATVPTCVGTPKTFTITVNPIVSITTQPVSQTKFVGRSVTFSVSATGSGLTYQWKKGTANITGATSASYSIPSVSAADAGDYSVVVSGSCGAPVTSSIANLTVNPMPDVVAVANQILCAGSASTAINFTGTVPGTAFKWTNSNSSIGLAASGTGDIPSFTATNKTGTPVTASVSVTPYFGTTQYAYIANTSSGNISVLNTTDNSVVTTIPIGGWIYGTVVTPDGTKVYVVNYLNDNVSVINTSTNTVTNTISLTRASGPLDLVVSPDGSKLYVTNNNSTTVSVISTADNTVIGTITVGNRPQGIVITPDGSKLYVVNYDSGTVSVITTADNKVIATIPIGALPTRIVISPDGSKVYVMNFNSKVISVITTADNTVAQTITLPNYPSAITISPDGSKLYLINFRGTTNSIYEVTTADNKVTEPFITSKGLGDIAVSPDGSKLYVASSNPNNLLVINTTDYSFNEAMTGGDGPVIYKSNIFSQYNSTTAGTAKTFTITVNSLPAAPTISYSGSSTICEGSSITLTSSAASGNQWYNGTAPISGATGETYTATASGNYTVKVTNACGTTASIGSVVVTVNPAPVAPTVTASGATTICAGGSVTLTSSASSGNQWYNGASAISGATGETYTATAVGDYKVVVTTSGCASPASSAVAVSVNAATTITTQPVAQVKCVGTDVTFTVAASGTGLSYQWKKGTATVGANASTLTLTNINTPDAGDYTVTITNDCGSTVTSVVATLTVKFKPAIPLITVLGNTLTSSASSGNQWYLNNTALAGATAQTYNVQEAGPYTVQVTQDGCSSTSAVHNFVPTRIEEPAAWNGEVLVYPNPVVKTFIVKNTTGHPLRVQLYNNLGQNVYDAKLVGTQSSISVEGLPRGAYQLMITDLQKGKSISQTILKQ